MEILHDSSVEEVRKKEKLRVIYLFINTKEHIEREYQLYTLEQAQKFWSISTWPS